MHEPAFPRWVFPNLQDGRVEPVELRFGEDLEDPEANLTPDEVEALRLSSVPAMASALGLQLDLQTEMEWHVRSLLPQQNRRLRGDSAQLAALLALTTDLVDQRASSRLQVERIRVVWSTGALGRVPGGGVDVVSVGGEPEGEARERLERKITAFLDSGDPLFICAAEDAAACRDVTESRGGRVIDVDEFAALVVRGTEISSRPLVVGIGPGELGRTVATLIEGAIPPETLPAPVLALAWQAGAITQNSARAIVRHASAAVPGILHLAVRRGHALGLAKSAEGAVNAALGVADALTVAGAPCGAAVHLGTATTDRVDLTGPAVEKARSLAAKAVPGYVTVTETALCELPRDRTWRGRQLEFERVGRFRDRVRTYALTQREDALPLAVPGELAEWSMTAAVIASALTLIRIPLGIATGLALYRGGFADAFLFYALGLASDVLDGWIARKHNGTTSWGKSWDPIIDMIFNTIATVGYVAGSLLRWGNILWAIGPLVATGGLVVVTRWGLPKRWRVEPDSALAKARSGVIRAALIAFILVKAPWTPELWRLVLVCIVFALFGLVEEWSQLREEVRSGQRDWFKSPPYRPPRRDQQILNSLLAWLARLFRRKARS